MCEQCGLCVVGVERETERLTAAKRREHLTTHDDDNDEGESCVTRLMSCDTKEISHDSQALSCDIHYDVDSTVSLKDWSSYVAKSLPLDLEHPFHVSVQLNVDTSHSATAKLSHLLTRLQGNYD